MKGAIFTYLLTYGGAAVSLARPFVGLLIYIAFAILRPDFLWWWSVPQGNYSRIVALGLLIGWALQGCGDWKLGLSKPVIVGLSGYWFWLVVTALSGHERFRLAYEDVGVDCPREQVGAGNLHIARSGNVVRDVLTLGGRDERVVPALEHQRRHLRHRVQRHDARIYGVR